MNIVITGHTGFIGGLLRIKAEEEGHRVIGVSKDTGTDLLQPWAIPPGAELVYHCAAHIGDRVTPSLFDENVRISYNVFSACHKARVPLVYVSTCEVYGDGLNLTEESPYKPPNMYSASKVSCEYLLKQFGSLGLGYRIVRLFNPLSLHNHAQFMIPAWLQRAKENQPFPIYGDSNEEGRDWVWQDDVIDGLWQARNWPNKTIAHLCGGDFYSNQRMAELLAAALEIPLRVEYLPHPHDHSRLLYQRGDPAHAALLGWTAKTSIFGALKRIVAQWRSS